MLKVYDTIVQNHDPRLVVLAIGICLLACYTAFMAPLGLKKGRFRAPDTLLSMLSDATANNREK